MRTSAALKAAALLGVAVVLALFTVQGTLALWNTAAVSETQAVTTADFAVLVAPAGGMPQRLISTGTVSMPPVTGLMRGTSRTTAITVTNATDAGSGSFAVRATAGTTQVIGPLAPYLMTTVSSAQGTDCAVTQAVRTLDLAQGASGTMCLTVSLAADAPATVGGAAASTELTLSIQQL